MIGIFKADGGFSDRWINYCILKNYDFKLLDIYRDDIIQQTKDCDIILMHPIQYDLKAELVFRQIVFSLEMSGKKIFPNFRTLWHFDDKVGQKYLFEAIDVPHVKSYVFTDRTESLQFIESTTFPKVVKLRGGAGSSNVKLLINRKSAKKWVNRMFGRGISQYNRFESLKERYRKFRLGKLPATEVIKGILRLFLKPKYFRVQGNDFGYFYLQDFIDNNKFDIRVVVINDKAFAIKRNVRENDFRASGSGNIVYNHTEIDNRCIELAFLVNKKINSQCIAYDFIFDEFNNPLIIEISYGFVPGPYDKCDGYWSENMHWHSVTPNPYGWIIENLIADRSL